MRLCSKKTWQASETIINLSVNWFCSYTRLRCNTFVNMENKDFRVLIKHIFNGGR